jgi:hypothetical protein
MSIQIKVVLLATTLAFGAGGLQAKEKRPEDAGPPEHACGIGPGEKEEKEKPEKPVKVRIMHCGCNEDGTDLVWKQIRVSSRAIGHLKHQPYSEVNERMVSCIANNSVEEVEIEHKPGGDCVLPEEEANIGREGGLPTCSQEVLDALGMSCSVDGEQEVPEPEIEEA